LIASGAHSRGGCLGLLAHFGAESAGLITASYARPEPEGGGLNVLPEVELSPRTGDALWRSVHKRMSLAGRSIK
jgi:hypothetical protein